MLAHRPNSIVRETQLVALMLICSGLGFASRAAVADQVTRDVSSFLGGDAEDQCTGAATDASGFLYLTGMTRSSSFLGEPAAMNVATYVVKLDLEATPPAVDWVTMFDSSAVEIPAAIAVGLNGVYVAGWTGANVAGLQSFAACPDPDAAGTSRDPFVIRLNAATGSVEAGARVRASGTLERVGSLAIHDGSGRVYVSGRTNTRPNDDCPFPTTDGSTVSCGSNGKCNVDLFLCVFSPDLVLEHATVIGGFGIDDQDDGSHGLAVDDAGRAYIAGYSTSDDFPVTDGSTVGGREDGVLVVVELLAAGATNVATAKYIGGSKSDRASAIAVEGSDVWLGGRTDSDDFPGAAGPNLGQDDVFVSRLDPDAGWAILHTTALAGSNAESVEDLAVDSSGGVFALGTTNSTDFSVTSDAEDGSHNGQGDAFVARLNDAGAVVHATFLGGASGERGGGIALSTLAGDPAGTTRVRVAGSTSSSTFPVTPDAIQATFGGGSDDAFVASYRFVAGPPAENCTNGVDDDGDGLADCADPDCAVDADGDGVDAAPCGGDCDDGDPSIPGPGEVCGDGVDNDCNGLVDCDEAVCSSDPGCQAPPCGEKNDPCAIDEDCCSANCRPNGRCAGSSGGAGSYQGVEFRRGDANADGAVDIADALFTIDFLFLRARDPVCADASDADDDGWITLADAVTTLRVLFLGSDAIPLPGTHVCGVDPTVDLMICERSAGCP